MRGLARRLPPSAFLVLNNGSTTRAADGRLLAAHEIPFETANRARALFGAAGRPAIWIESANSGDRYLVDGAWESHEAYRRYLEPKGARVCRLPNPVLAPPPAQLFGLLPLEQADGFERRLRAELHGRASVVAWQSRRLQSAGFEVLPPGVTKGAAVASLAASLGVHARNALAVGDDLNDLEMLQWAGRALAVHGAPAPLRQAADQTLPNTPHALPRLLKSLAEAQDD